jgi:hypothetical protein
MITGAGIDIHVDRMPNGVNVAKAWGTSRPNDKTSKLVDVLKVDTPVNEIEDFILTVKCPIIFREMLFSLRDHVAWARTSRVDDLNRWEVYYQYADHPGVKECYKSMMSAQVRNEAQDNFREWLPMVYLTSFTLKLSARTLIRFTQGINELRKSISLERSPKLWDMVNDFYKELRWAINQSIYQDLPIETYGAENIFPMCDNIDVANVSVMQEFVYCYVTDVPVSLRAQLVRHRPVMIRDTMRNFLTEDGVTMPIRSPVDVAMVMSLETAQNMVKKRNCWIAQEDLWSPIVKQLNKALGPSDGFILPCTNKTECPVAQDNQLRYDGKDPAPPCPIWCGMGAKPVTFNQRTDVLRYIEKRTNSTKFWQGQVQSQLAEEEGA